MPIRGPDCTPFDTDRTPARTLANIFFEIGVALVRGKPVQLVWTARDIGRSAVPSDFIRTEWIRYTVGGEERLRRELGSAIDAIEQGAAYTDKSEISRSTLPSPIWNWPSKGTNKPF